MRSYLHRAAQCPYIAVTAVSYTHLVPLLFGLRGEGVLQPHHRREHQPSAESGQRGVRPVSYTHLDVYKRHLWRSLDRNGPKSVAAHEEVSTAKGDIIGKSR